MNSSNQDKAELQNAILEKRALIVAGTGVSISASYDAVTKQSHPQASWAGLLENGLQWLKEHKLMDEDIVDSHLKLLKKNPQTHRFISAAEDIVTGMGGVDSVYFVDWLANTVGKIKANDRNLLDAIEALRVQGNILATTNYDGLLLGNPALLTPITWQDSDAIVGAMRKRDTSNVIFLHGYWRKPASVILDWKSYDQIARDQKYRDDLVACWKTTTWIYIGCGVSGLNDPDFGLLLERYGQRARDAGHWDYCLVREDQRDAFQAHFEKNNFNIRAVSFGKNHGDLPQYLRSLLPAPAASSTTPAHYSTIPTPPAFYAKPDYIGRHDFVGRKAQLQTLTEWAKPTDPTSILLFEAIGGNGKSMLTWEWTTKHAEAARAGHELWAGRFWYSFYEKGAIMRDFCLHALHYMTQQPMETLEKKPMADLRTALLAQLHARPWLLILDGLERVLVAYHRIDAAEVRDEEVNRPTDKILDRDPCDAIRDEDTELLRALAAAKPSKILISSRLIPRVMLNPSGLPLPGVRPLVLPGLDDADAEELFCEVCGIQGTSADIRYYLKTFCDNHPLVIGVLAGLINSPGPHRGHFDAWAAAPEYGAKLNLARLDLIQSRNHILRAAMDALESPSRQLLSTLALLTDAVDYNTVAAFNPHLPPEPEEVDVPTKPEDDWEWDDDDEEVKERLRKEYEGALAKRKAYERAMQAWRDPAAVREAPKKLGETLRDLERRGLVQYDGRTQRYDLHPVVRGVAAGGMKAEDKERYGQRVVDHFNAQPHPPYEQAKTMDDVAIGLHVVRTLLKLGRHQQAANAYGGDLSRALLFNLEAHVELLAVLRPFFPAGWDTLPKDLYAFMASGLANNAAIALHYCGEDSKALRAYGAALRVNLETADWITAGINLSAISVSLSAQNLLTKTLRVDALTLELATVCENNEDIFSSRLHLFACQSCLGQWQAAEATWRLRDPMGRAWSRAVYRQGMAEYYFARFHFWQCSLQEEHLAAAATLAEQDGNRVTLRALHWLRGAWRLEQGEWALAVASFDTAVTMAREVRLVDEDSETGLALTKHHLGQLPGDAARSEAERLAGLRDPAHRYLALLWLAIGDPAKAEHHALAAYRWAWADGEPYVNRYELTKTTELLQQMNVPVPVLPPYDPAKDEPFPWEADVRAAIEKLKAEKEAKKRKKKVK